MGKQRGLNCIYEQLSDEVYSVSTKQFARMQTCDTKRDLKLFTNNELKSQLY